MFWFCVIFTLVTYPVVLLGCVICFLLVAVMSFGTMDNIPDVFISPLGLYNFYKKTFNSWVTGITQWYKIEKGE